MRYSGGGAEDSKGGCGCDAAGAGEAGSCGGGGSHNKRRCLPKADSQSTELCGSQGTHIHPSQSTLIGGDKSLCVCAGYRTPSGSRKLGWDRWERGSEGSCAGTVFKTCGWFSHRGCEQREGDRAS